MLHLVVVVEEGLVARVGVGGGRRESVQKGREGIYNIYIMYSKPILYNVI